MKGFTPKLKGHRCIKKGEITRFLLCGDVFVPRNHFDDVNLLKNFRFKLNEIYPCKFTKIINE
jgi:hypothetical protein